VQKRERENKRDQESERASERESGESKKPEIQRESAGKIRNSGARCGHCDSPCCDPLLTLASHS